MNNLKNEKFKMCEKKELARIMGGGYWKVVTVEPSRYSTTDENGNIHWGIRTWEHKYHNDGTLVTPTKSRPDK